MPKKFRLSSYCTAVNYDKILTNTKKLQLSIAKAKATGLLRALSKI